MDYEGKFRDFMSGWLAGQLKEPGVHPEEIEALYYDAVAYAENDRAALTEVEKVLGEGAQMLRGLSDGWDDPTVEAAREMIEHLRELAQIDFGDSTKFYLFFLNPFKEGCVPDGFEDNLEREIGWMFRVFYETVGAAIFGPHGWEPYVVVRPAYEDASEIIILAHPQAEFERKVFVWQAWSKAWNLRFTSLTELAEELLELRQMMEHRAIEALRQHSYAERDL